MKQRVKRGVRKTAQVARISAAKTKHHSRKVFHATRSAKAKVTSTKTYHVTKKATKKVHHHVAKKPHEKLMAKSVRYAKWHSWNYKGIHHGHVHGIVATAWTFIVIAVFMANTLTTTALSTWSQTDWSGGQGTSTANQFASKNNIDINGGSFSITPDEKLTNGGFEEDLEGWRLDSGKLISFDVPISYSSGYRPFPSVSGDIDNDGDVDIINGANGYNHFSVFKNTGNGLFAARQQYSTGSAWTVTGLYLVDLDKDGFLDLVVSANNVPRILIYRNNTTGNFTSIGTYNIGTSGLMGVSMADFDNDGDLDVVTAQYASNAIAVLPNNGNGSMGTPQYYPTGTNPLYPNVGDFDRDGDVDIAVANLTSGTISIFMNDGYGAFAPKIDYSAGNIGSRNVEVADIDNDDDLDLVYPSQNGNFIATMKNNGDGTFAQHVPYDVGSNTGPWFVSLGDMDNDGDLDVLVGNSAANHITFFKNNGLGILFRKQEIAVGNFSGGIAINKFDNDDKKDIVVNVDNTSGLINYYSNNTTFATFTHEANRGYNGSTSSMKVISTSKDIIYQSLNIGNTKSYMLQAFVYTDGTAISSDDASIYVGESAVATTYTEVGDGWYRLSAQVSGSNSIQKYGVQIEPNKTVYIDDVGLHKFDTGTLTSSILDTDLGSAWGNITYATSGTGEVTVKARTSNNADMSEAPAFAGCAPIASGSDLTDQSCATDNHRYIQYEVTLTGQDGQTPVFEDISIEYSPYDNTPPSQNAEDISMKKSAGGSTVNENAWTNGNNPYFEWNEGNDSGTGVKGYCLYLGTDSTADPVTTKGILGNSPVNTEGACQFAVAENYIDTATNGYLATALTSSNSPYYLNIKAVDNAHNVYDGDSAQFHFRFDNTAPKNPDYITAPSQFVSNKEVTLTWPTTGNASPGDSHSGLVGLQYRIGENGKWYGDDHTGDEDINDVLNNDGSYTTVDPPDFDSITDGNNVVYFRGWDNAGNVSTVYPTTVIKYNSNSPTSPLNVQASPSTNTTNSFAFSWAVPSSYRGSASSLTYCYSINTLPNQNTCTFTAAGVTNLPAGAFATQPGANTFYVVARDEAGNINYDTAASTTFTANTSAPGIPLDIEIADVSTRATSSWRLALSWSVPSDTGAGIASYRVFRSVNGTSFSQVASTGGTSHVDGGLNQTNYHYKVQACDSANNCGAFSSVVQKLPTGRYTVPANLTAEPKVSGVSTRKATVSWATDRTSDSKISIGTKSGQYDPFQIASPEQVTDHKVELNNLTAGTTYYAQATWTDEDGNIGRSSEFSFKTDPAPTTQDVSTLRVGLNSAQIQFTSVAAAKVVIQYGRSDNFGGVKEISTSLSKSTYQLELVGLDDGSKYMYRLNTYDSDGNLYEGSTILNFTTPARPAISNLRFQPVAGEPTSTQEVTWTTNVPTTSLVRFAPVNSAQKEISDSELKTEHKIIIRDLIDDREYTLSAESRDADGNLAVSDLQNFKTALDTRPPKISNVKVETSIKGTGAEARGQIIVSWKTDEPATSQVAYGQGSGLKTLNNKTSEDATLSTEHIVIISDLATSRVYTVQPVSNDRSRNQAEGASKSAIIGRASDSIISIVLNTLRGVFGF